MAGLAALALGFVLSQFYRSFLAVLTPDLSADLGASEYALSSAAAAWFVAFAFAQFIVGFGLDRYGPRRTCSILLLLGGAGGAVLFALATAPWMIIAAMALIGVGCSPVLMASYFIFAKQFSPARFTMLASTMVGVGSMGNIAGSIPLALAAEALGWRLSMAGLAAATLAVSAAILLFVRDPKEVPGTIRRSDDGLSGYLTLLKIRDLWPILAIGAISYSVPVGLRGLWSGPYLEDTFAAGAVTIGYATFGMSVAMAIGSTSQGFVEPIFPSRKRLVLIGGAITLVALILLIIVPSMSLTGAIALLCTVGLCGMSYALIIAHARDFFPDALTGRGMTLLNFFSLGGAGLWQYVTGFAASFQSQTDYRLVFGIYAVLLGMGLAAYVFSRDTRSRKRAPDQPEPSL